MTEPSLASLPHGELLAVLRRRAAVRRDTGAIPEGLVEELDRFAVDVLRRAAVPPSGDPLVLASLEVLRSTSEAVRSESNSGELLDRYVAAVEETLNALTNRLASLEGLVFRAERTLERVERLEEAEAQRDFRPWYPSGAFEAHFRGEHEQVLAGARTVAAWLEGCAPVLDLGCGRGEHLAALGERNIEARGIDLHAGNVAHVQSLGLAAEHGDGVQYLRGLPDAALGGLTLFQVIEHLSPQQQLDVVELAAQKIRSGGRCVIESVNPLSLYVYTHALYLDPTHTRPVHPYYLEFLLLQAGFAKVTIEWRSPVPEIDRVDRDALPENVRPAFDRIMQFLEAPQDYVLVATR